MNHELASLLLGIAFAIMAIFLAAARCMPGYYGLIVCANVWIAASMVIGALS